MRVWRECRDAGPACQQECCPGHTLAEHICLGYYWVWREPIAILTRAASAASAMKSGMGAQWLLEDTILERLPPHLQHVAFELGPLVEAQEAVVRQRHLTGHGHLTTADHADVGNGMVRRAKGTRGDDGGVAAGPAGDTVGASGVQDFGQRHGWQDSGEPTGQYGCACFCRPQQQMIADQNSTA
jgi:hypothetical protein